MLQSKPAHKPRHSTMKLSIETPRARPLADWLSPIITEKMYFLFPSHFRNPTLTFTFVRCFLFPTFSFVLCSTSYIFLLCRISGSVSTTFVTTDRRIRAIV